jgi:glycosyltransferase involved in cell wall biosynthesis
MEPRRRRVLVLAYYFPPLGGGGVQRTLKFVRYLEPLGWDATVISTRSRLYPARDPYLLSEVPASTRIVRPRAVPLGHYLGIALHRLRLGWLREWVLWPDGGLGWAPFALVSALRAARREKPDVLFSTSAPYGAHLIALLVARLTGLPWVADFRDEWSTNASLTEQPKALAALTARSESTVTRQAQRVVVVADYFRLVGIEADDPRRVEIVNGADEADLPNPPPLPRPDKFVLTNVGTIYGSIDPRPGLRVLAALVAKGAIDAERLEVRLVGSIWEPNFVPPTGITIATTGYVDHSRAVAEMSAATALLLFRPSSTLAPSGKVFEYLASGRPILCLTHPDNLASRLVRDWNAGTTANPDDPRAIEHAILTLWQRWEDGDLPDQAEVRRWTLERYSRRANTVRLAEVFDELCSD